MLRFSLLLRALANLLFGVLALATTTPRPAEAFREIGVYATVDGVLALLTAAMLFRAPRGRWVSWLAALDGLVRVIFGLVILRSPWIETQFWSHILFLAAAFTIVCTLGILGLAVAGLAPHGGTAPALAGTRWPVIAASGITLVLALAIAFGLTGSDDSRRLVVGAYAIAIAVVLASVGLRRELGRPLQA